MDKFFTHADSFLIFFYRITGVAPVDYFIGTFVLALICVMVGDVSISLGIRFNKSYIDDLNREVDEKEAMSIRAYEQDDKRSYKALNKDATDAWGKKFFTMAGYSAGLLWPIPVALGWMQTRFQGVEFPLVYPLSLLIDRSMGYIFSFIPIYILVRIIFKYLRPFLPYFRGVQKLLDEKK
ncbi:MAG: hypothetical protein ABII06_13575 [Pseudomonadota bacterium]